MKCYAELNGKKVKTFNAKTMNTIYNQYNDFCKQKLNNAKYVLDNTVIGNMYWTDGTNTIILKKHNNIS